jgi:exoribonuclease-2
MGTVPSAHEGIGVASYAWCSSPLRRYVDLVNQRQLLAAVRGEPAPYPPNDAELFAIVSTFDAVYAQYGEFQEKLERYWCLRWLRQESVTRIGAMVLKPDLLRLDGLPLVTRIAGLPMLERGQRVELDVLHLDEVDLSVELRLHRVLGETAARLDDFEEELADAAADEAPPAPAPAT